MTFDTTTSPNVRKEVEFFPDNCSLCVCVSAREVSALVFRRGACKCVCACVRVCERESMVWQEEEVGVGVSVRDCACFTHIYLLT